MHWRPFLVRLIDAVFPPYCVACREFGSWMCTNCLASLVIYPDDRCVRCARSHRESTDCSQTLTHIDVITAVGPYRDVRLRMLVTALKFRGATCVAPALRLLFQQWKTHRLNPVPWAGGSEVVITWIPTDPQRVEDRGFDQAELLAHLLQEELAPWMRVVPLLERIAKREPQSELEDAYRRVNVVNLFRVNPAVPIPQSVILVDDVITTGSTADEASRVLKNAGVEGVILFTIAAGR